MRNITQNEVGLVSGGDGGDSKKISLESSTISVLNGAYRSGRVLAPFLEGLAPNATAAAVTAGSAAVITTATALSGAGYLGYEAGTAIYDNSKTVRDGAAKVIEYFCGPAEAEAACVHIESILPCGRKAGQIVAGDVMQLGDEKNFEDSTGVVTFSKRKKASGYRITTVGGVALVCSNTAPIPTPDGLVLAPNLLKLKVAVRRKIHGVYSTIWELVEQIDELGEIDVQHITVGNKCFWAGEKSDSYILHHNCKNVTNLLNGGMSDAEKEKIQRLRDAYDI